MSRLTFADLSDHIGDYLKDKQPALIRRAANLVLRDVARKIGPIKRSTFTTVPPYSTGTVTGTIDSTTLTGSSTAWTSASHAGQDIRIGGAYEWFNIDSVASNTSLTLSSKYPGATTAGLSYEIAFPLVTLETDVLEIIEIGRIGEEPLTAMAHDRVAATGWSGATGVPDYWMRAPLATNGAYRIRLSARPDARYTFSYSYRQTPTLYDDKDSFSYSDIADGYDDAVIYGTLAHLFNEEGSFERAAYWNGRYEKAMGDVKGSVYSAQSFPRASASQGKITTFTHGQIGS